MKKDEAVAQARVFKALGNSTRLLMVDELSRRDCCVSEMRSLARVDPSVISRHLAQLKQAGVVIERRAGNRSIHHLECHGVLQAMAIAVGVLRSDAARRTRLSGGA